MLTAEIAIMNKSAIALAADSAVTIEVKNNIKIYNTVNKLFTLSKYHPVGIMVYGSADLMGIPWESLIKIYRNKLSDKSFPNLEDYSKDFVDFLDNDNPLFPEAQQDNYFMGTVHNFFELIKDEINDEVRKKTNGSCKVSSIDIEEAVEDVICKYFDIWDKATKLTHLPDEYAEDILNKYNSFIQDTISKVFQKLPISEKGSERLFAICYNLFLKDKFPINHAGIVIAGFGDEDTFPVLNSYTIDSVVNKKYAYNKGESGRISFENTSLIVPFAQRKNVSTFVEGIDPNFKQVIYSYIEELFKNYPNNVVENIKFNSELDRKDHLKKLNNISEEILKDFVKNIEEYIYRQNVDPITTAVEFLPKDELASMAESLVNLTSFKQKISMDSETVGGPIDVAVISKGDGFVWIQRKHYFQPELNPHYISKYFYSKKKDNKNE